MDKTTELKRLVNLNQIRDEMKMYKIKQSQIARATGLTRCMISRYLSGVKPKDAFNGEVILNTAKALIANSEREVEKMGNK
jgi:transcriptional regulator with XRE-family HTH domain